MGHKPNPAQDDTPPPVPVPRTHTSGVSPGKKRSVVHERPQSAKKHQKGPNSGGTSANIDEGNLYIDTLSNEKHHLNLDRYIYTADGDDAAFIDKIKENIRIQNWCKTVNVFIDDEEDQRYGEGPDFKTRLQYIEYELSINSEQALKIEPKIREDIKEDLLRLSRAISDYCDAQWDTRCGARDSPTLLS